MRSHRLALWLGLAVGLVAGSDPAAADPDPLLRHTLAATGAERRALPRVELHGFPGGGTATTRRLGRLSFTTFSNGLRATSIHTGRAVFTTLSDGSRAVTTGVGPGVATTLHGGRTITTLRNGSVTFSSQSLGTAGPTEAGFDFQATRYEGPAVVPGGGATGSPGAFLPTR